jgi:hypothetical protein
LSLIVYEKVGIAMNIENISIWKGNACTTGKVIYQFRTGLSHAVQNRSSHAGKPGTRLAYLINIFDIKGVM